MNSKLNSKLDKFNIVSNAQSKSSQLAVKNRAVIDEALKLVMKPNDDKKASNFLLDLCGKTRNEFIDFDFLKQKLKLF